MAGGEISRRRFAGTAAALGVVLGARAVTAQQAPDVAIVTTDGVAGGGTLTNLGHEVPFSLAVFAHAREGSDPVVQGTLRLRDDASPDGPVVLESEFFNTITALSDDAPNALAIQGWARVNGNGPFPFVLQVEDVGEPGSGEDTVNLVLGDAALPFLGGDAKNCDCGGYSYSLRSNVVAGDITLFALM